jgi:thiol:disulfide interchange protein/DsbC/DsbD-like thiol-disulfide interchange protein
MRWLTVALTVLTVALSQAPASPARAAESPTVSTQHAAATLVTDSDTLEPGKPLRVGLHLHLAPGWHTYWKNPGDAGQPPALSFTLPPGATTTPIEWPTPQRIAEGPVMTYAYTGEVLLPVKLTVPLTVPPTGPAGTASPITIKAHADYLVCKDICVPESADLAVVVPVGPPAASAQAPLFAAHDHAVPRASPWTAQVARDGTLFVQGPELTPATVTDATFIPDETGVIQDDAAQILSVREGGFTLSLKPGANFKAHQNLSGILSVRDRSGLLTDVAIVADPGNVPAPVIPPLPTLLAFAFLGGLILNLMPCVFPVLAMKAVSLASSRRQDQHRAHALSYTAGILVTFTALAAALVGARSAGIAAGWGFQFSSPVFVAAMAWLLFAVGLNLSGVFEVGGGFSGVGRSIAARRGHLGSFFTGLLAVLVATPCTAPFMGVAVAAGLAAPPPITALVFLVMGLGLAAPFLVLSMVPRLQQALPRSGRWMEVFKQALAFPMYGAAAWLIWVVSQEAGSNGVLVALAGLVLIGFAAWVYGVTQSATTGSRRFGQAAAVIAMMIAATVLPGTGSIAGNAGRSAANTGGPHAETFSADKLATLRNQGRGVFVNMTAAWCVTCLVNERVAIATDTVRHAFEAKRIAYLEGDWTRQDPAITAFLQANARDGVPLYVFYPENGGSPHVLPQILTQAEVLRTIGAAS